MAIEDEQKMIEYLKKNPGRIGVIGDKLLEQELEKRKNGEKSKIFDFLEKQGKCRLFVFSSNNARNNEYLMLETLKANPGRIGAIGDELLEQELEKREKGEKSKIFNLLEEQGECTIFTDSSNNVRNNEYLMLENLKVNPGRIGVIGDELLKQELEKREKGEKSKIFDLLEKQEKCTIYTDSSNNVKNNEYLMIENLKANPGRIGVIGDELLKQELEKREKSKIFDLLEEQGKCTIYIHSSDNVKNNEYLMLENLKTNPGKIGVIGDELLKQELEKREKGEKSKILDLLDEQDKCMIYYNSLNSVKNNEYLMLKNLKANPGRVGIIGDELLKQELEKRENGEKSKILDLIEEQKKCSIYNDSSEYVKNNEYLVKKYLEFESNIDLNRIGQNLLREELEKGFKIDSKTNKKVHNSEIINKLVKLVEDKKINTLPEIVLNNADFMKFFVEKDINNLSYLNEKVFEKIWKDENIKKEAEEGFKLKASSSEFIKNNEELIQISLKKDFLTLNYVGEKYFEKYLEECKDIFSFRIDALEHVKCNSKAIQYTIKNKPAQLMYINQDIIINEFKKITEGEESQLFEQLFESIGIKDKSDFIDTLKRVYEKNNSVFENLNINLMKECYKPVRSSLNVWCDDTKLQNKITFILGKNRNVNDIKILGKVLDSVLQYNDGINKKDLIGDIISGMASNEYLELIKNIRDKELKEEDVEKLGWLFCNRNYFSIKKYEDIQNLDDIINQTCEKIMNNPEDDFSKYPLINKMSPVTRVEHAVMMKSGYMMGINEAVKLQEMFLPLFDGIDESTLTEEELAIRTELQNFKYIRTLEDDEALDFCKEFYNIVSQEQEMKTYKAESYQTDILCNLATRLYNEKNYKPVEKEFFDNIKYNETNIPVYNAGTDFSMLIHVVGAYNSDSRNIESYKESWNRPETQKHGFSASYIGNGMLGIAKLDSVIYGFNQIENGGLIAAAPWDIASNTKVNGEIPVQSIDTLNKLSKGNRVKVCNPEKQLLNTRHTHNEIILERNIVQKDGSLKKRQPDYVIYIVNNYDKTEAKLDPYWNETKRAAAEFGIPIVIVEREKCAQKEAEEIEKMLSECKNENNMQIAVDTLNKLQANIAGCRDYNVEIKNKYFPDSKTQEVLESIKEILHKDLSENKNKFKKDYELAIKFEEEENKKWEITGIGGNRTEYKGYDHELFKNELQEIAKLNNKKSQVNEEKLDVEKILEKDDEDIQKLHYSSRISECINNNEQIENKEVIDIIKDYNIEDEIKDIKSTKLYDERKAHSIHHIQNVTIFGTVLGHKLGLKEHEMKLLIEACKYHDSGRTDDNNYEHAYKSQKIAQERLEEKYSSDDIGIIRTAIRYHEYFDKDKEEADKFFKDICKAYNVQSENIEKARNIADILKDADALDRCRFVNKAELNPSFLRFEESRSLVEVAKKINEGYAKQVCEQKGYLKDDEIKKEIQQYGYLSTERRIRKTGALHNNTEKRNIKNKAISVKTIGKRTFPASKREDRDLMLSILEQEQVMEKQEELEI